MSGSFETPSLEICLERYQDALHRGQRPPLENFLPDSPSRFAALVELLHVELEYRLKHGEDATVERYLERYPELNQHPTVVDELRQAEQKFRLLGPISPSPAELAADTLAALRQATTATRKFPQVPGYEILGELGRGGMSVVYRAWQHKLNRLVALKMVRGGEQATPGELLRLFSEAETIAKLQHPHIVQIYEIGQHEGLPYLTLELCNAGTLATYLKGDPLPADQVVPLMTTLARTVQVAHQRGVIHRDLKPGNILFLCEAERPTLTDPPERIGHDEPTREYPQGVEPQASAIVDMPAPDPAAPPRALSSLTPKITDFGLAKRVEISWHLTHSNVLIGTPSYMAPEQAGGEASKVTPAADIYALGAILFELLTGRPPFKGTTVGEIVTQVLHQDPPSLHQLNPGVPRDLATICLKCLAKAPGARYGSAQELAEDLERYQRGELIHARPASLLERGWKWTKRHPVAGGSMLAGLGFAVAIISGLLWHNSRLSATNTRATNELNALRAELEARNQRIQDESDNQRYSNDMRVGQQLLSHGNWPRLQELLSAHEKPRGLLGEHGFDWHYLRQFRLDKRSERRAEDAGITVLQFNGDGTRLMTQTVYRANVNTHVWAFQESRFGQESSRFEAAVGMLSHPTAALSPDGRWVAFCSTDGNLHLYNAKTGGQKGIFVGTPEALAFSADSKRLAICDNTHALRVFSVPDLQPLASCAKVLATHEPYLAFSPDGEMVVVGGALEVRAWKVGAKSARTLFSSAPPLRALFYSPSGRLLLCLSDSTLAIWDNELDGLRGTWRIEAGTVRTAALSPDETVLATGSSDGQIALWNFATRELLATWRHDNNGIARLAFTPDGNFLASADDKGQVIIQPFRLPARYQRLSPQFVFTGPVVWSPDGHLVAAADTQQRALVLDATTGELVRALGPHLGAVDHLAFLPGGGRLATAHHYDGRVTLWDVRKGVIVETLRPGVKGPLRALVSAGPNVLLTVTADGRLHRWDLTTGKDHGHPVQGDIVGVAVTRDGKLLATAGRDRVVRLWGGDGWGNEIGQRTLERSVTDLTFSPDGKLVVTNSESGSVESWQAEVGLAPVGTPIFWSGGDGLGRVRFSPNGEYLFVHGSSANWQGYDWAKREKRWDGITYHNPAGMHWHTLEFSPEGKRLAVTRTDGTLQFWTVPFFHVHKPRGQLTPPVQDLVFLDNERLLSSHPRPPVELSSRFRVSSLPLVTGREAVFIQRLKGKTTDHLRLWELPHSREVPNGLEASPSVSTCRLLAHSTGGLLAGAGEDGSVYIWDRQSGKKVTRVFINKEAEVDTRQFEMGWAEFTSSRPDYKEGISAVAFSPDGAFLLAQGTAGGLRVWETTAWKVVGERGAETNGPLVSPLWLSGPRNGWVGMFVNGQLRLWHPRTGETAATGIGQAHSLVGAAAVSADGKYLALATSEQVIQLWDMHTGQMRSLIGHRGAINVLEFSPNGKLLASGGQDALVRLWNVAAAQEVAALDGHRGPVTALRFRADGLRLASGSGTPQGTGEILLWGK